MASGGHKPKGAASEPRQRSSWQRTTSMSDKEDNISINSIPNELRPNNWDFSDWQPTNKDQTKRRKKGNPEWEREQSLTQESPPPSEKHYSTPKTFPRTKITSNTPKSQRVALENLRQRMTFSDQDDAVSNEGERNNERNVVNRRENPPNYTRQDTGSGAESLLPRPVANRRDDRNNRNNNKQNEARGLFSTDGKPDSSQIVSRLMQIRDYIKQAGAMMETLKKSGDPLTYERSGKLSQLIKVWRDQEAECLRELTNIVPGYRDEMDRLQKLIDHLREQEGGYTGLLESVLSLRENAGVNDMSHDLTPNLDSVDDTQSLDLDVQSEVSEDRSPSASSRPRIEDNLGLTSDNDDGGEDKVPSESSGDSSNMDDTVVSGRKNQEWDYEEGRPEAAIDAVMHPVEAAEQLAALRQQQELLTKLVEQQEQMRALRGRQAALLALQQDAERKLANARENRNEANAQMNELREVASNMTSRVDALSALQQAGRQPDADLQNLRQQLQFLKNELNSQNDNVDEPQRNVAPSRPERPPSPRQAVVPPAHITREQMQARLQVLLEKRDKLDSLLETELSAGIPQPSADMSRDQLRNKLVELQAKKARMDDMLMELQTLREDPYMTRNNASQETAARDTNLQNQMSEGEAAMARAEATENLANDVLGVLDVRQKHQKLSEVREKLGQLKSLVRYYQSADDDEGQEEDQSSMPVYSDYGAESDANRERGYAAIFKESKGKPAQETKTNVNIPVQATQQSDENNSSSSSDSESQLSSLGPWGDDPEIQEKVRKLKAAKEKLKHLQSLVAMVQHAPDSAGSLPDNIAEMAASMDDGEPQYAQADDRNNASLSEGEVPSGQAERDEYYQKKMTEQFEELAQLKNEKEKLLAIQGQLQELHDRFQQNDNVDGAQEEEAEREETKLKSKRGEKRTNTQQQQDNTQQTSSGPSVTFSSNEEVYDKMRKQRMLREELRDKKKQLESIMKKDRNKKQYIKNQDNQSDTGTYNTDGFGTAVSADATMATWGGSTVDNLESITEDGGGDQQDNEDEDDDGYPLDGIMQVEEEEEENNSDNETYTIEEDVRQRRKARGLSGEGDTTNRQTKSKRSFPRPTGKKGEGARPKESWNTRPPSFSKWSRSTKAKSRQENYRSAEEIVQDDEETDGTTSKSDRPTLEMLQQQLEQTNRLCQTLMGEQTAGPQLARLSVSGYPGMVNPMVPDIQQQLQQQQLLLSLNQCYQQMGMQQMEIQNMQRQMQSLILTHDSHETNDSGLSSDLRVRSYPSLFSPMVPRPSPQMSDGFMVPRTSLQAADGFMFNPTDISREAIPRSPERLLRSATREDSVFEPERPYQFPDRSSRYSRTSRQDSYAKKKKSSPSGGQRVSSTAAQTRTDSADRGSQTRESGAVPPLQFEQFLARKKREFLERNQLYPRTPDTPSASGGVGTSRSSDPLYRPGLSAGISGAGYLEDGRSVTSSVQSNTVAAITQALSDQAQTREQREADDANELSLFETLRETIYSEVATLISQNENRPHYLIELFRELQLLTTDYLRQRVLYDIKDVVSKYLVDENTDSVSAPPPPWMNTAMGNFNASELTPSESLVTSDDEDVKAKLKERAAALEKRKALLRSGSLKNDQFDYQEVPEISSSVSTPSNSYWDSPFNQDSLGETVIHLDKTLQRMRDYEKKLAEKEKKVNSQKSQTGETTMTQTDRCSSSAMDQGSEASATSDVPYPRIDTQQLDQQIKSIMTEVIPVIKEHMDNMCSPQLLAYIKRLVLSLTRQYDSGQEFARFFHRQLGSILQDTLAKYEGRKMRECGEDLLVDMSEVLFNELAFFRLMQDLDDPLIAEKMQQAQYGSEEENDLEQQSDESDTTESSTANATNNEEITDAADVTQTEEEDLGKSRDDAFANEVEIQDADDKDEEPESPYKTVQVELAVSEQKPYTRIGSDEDDEDADDESQSNEDPSETAVSINAKMVVINGEDFEEDNSVKPDTSAVTKADGASGKQESGGSKQDGSKKEDMGVAAEAEGQTVSTDQGDADQGASSGKTEQKSAEFMNGDFLNGDIEVITMDDLPASLTVMSQEQLQYKVGQEQQNNTGAAAILNSVEIENELAGDGEFLKEPDEASG